MKIFKLRLKLHGQIYTSIIKAKDEVEAKMIAKIEAEKVGCLIYLVNELN